MGTMITCEVLSQIFGGYDILLEKICGAKFEKIFQTLVFQKKAEAYLEPCPVSTMKLFAKVVYGFPFPHTPHENKFSDVFMG